MEQALHLCVVLILLITVPAHRSLRCNEWSGGNLRLASQLLPKCQCHAGSKMGRGDNVKRYSKGELTVGGEGTPPKEDIRPDTKLLWPFLFPQSLLLSVDCETQKKGQRQTGRIDFAVF